MCASLGTAYLYNVCLTGDAGVGKTSIFNSARGRDFSKSPKAETDFCDLPFVVKQEDDGKDINLTIKLWDTAGQDRYNSLTESYYRGKNAVVIVFAVNCRESFLSVYRFIKELKSNDYSPDAVYFLVGNKIDLKHDEVSQTQVDDCQKSNPGVFAAYLRTSAKKSKTVDKLLNVVAQTLVSNRVKPVRRDNLFRPIYDSPTNKVDCF